MFSVQTGPVSMLLPKRAALIPHFRADKRGLWPESRILKLGISESDPLGTNQQLLLSVS